MLFVEVCPIASIPFRFTDYKIKILGCVYIFINVHKYINKEYLNSVFSDRCLAVGARRAYQLLIRLLFKRPRQCPDFRHSEMIITTKGGGTVEIRNRSWEEMYISGPYCIKIFKLYEDAKHMTFWWYAIFCIARPQRISKFSSRARGSQQPSYKVLLFQACGRSSQKQSEEQVGGT